MIDPAQFKVREKLLAEWKWTKTHLSRLSSVLALRPTDDHLVIRTAENNPIGEIAIEIGPVVFNVPERGNHRRAPLFVYVTGLLSFSRQAWMEHNELVTTNTQTEAAYFRESGGDLQMVHGAHYDYAPRTHGHPAFHVQLRGSLIEYGSFIKHEFGLKGEVTDGINAMIRNVRSPSAQIDAFSCMLQLAADHLLPPSVTPDQRHTFNALRERAGLCGPYCQSESDQATPSSQPTRGFRCYRARHWYPRI